MKKLAEIKQDILSVEYEILDILYEMQDIKNDEFVMYNRLYSDEHRKFMKKYKRKYKRKI